MAHRAIPLFTCNSHLREYAEATRVIAGARRLGRLMDNITRTRALLYVETGTNSFLGTIYS